jgi:hypothetical protein
LFEGIIQIVLLPTLLESVRFVMERFLQGPGNVDRQGIVDSDLRTDNTRFDNVDRQDKKVFLVLPLSTNNS